jgi:lia operon protein LiaF
MFARKEFWGVIILLIGLLWLFGNLDFIDYSLRRSVRDLWPVILIIAGIILIVRHKRPPAGETIVDTFIGGDSRRAASVHKTFGNIIVDAGGFEISSLAYSTVFGDMHINLGGGRLKTDTGTLDVTATFGNITILIPADMETQAFASSVFGDLYVLGKSASGISNSLTAKSKDYDSAGARLHVYARTTFGDVKIHQA